MRHLHYEDDPNSCTQSCTPGWLTRLYHWWLSPKVVNETAVKPDATPTCLKCGKVLDSPPTGPYPTREEYKRETTPAMAMLRAMEVMDVHNSHG